MNFFSKINIIAISGGDIKPTSQCYLNNPSISKYHKHNKLRWMERVSNGVCIQHFTPTGDVGNCREVTGLYLRSNNQEYETANHGWFLG